MFASMRSKKKTRDSPGVAGSAVSKADQQQQQTSRRKDAIPEALKLPSPLRYYPGTQMPMDGWFHACRLCRCWTAFSATATTGEVVPLCRRCLPTAARKGVQTAPKVSSQASQKPHSSSAAAPAASGSTANKAQPTASIQRMPHKASDTAAKGNHAWGSSYTNLHQQAQQYQQQAQQQQVQQQQQQRYQQQPAPGHAKPAHSYKAGSRVLKPAGSGEGGSYIAPSQAAAAAAAATAAMAPPAVPPAVPAANAATQHTGYSRTSSSSSIPDRRSSTGDGYVACYKHLGPTNMHSSTAPPADAYITCLGTGGADNSASGSSREHSGSDMLGAITSLLSDLYNMRFSASGSIAGSRSSSRSDSHEVLSRSNSAGSRKGAAAAAAAAADTLRNLPI